MTDNFDPSLSFYEGQDVVCVDAKFASHQHPIMTLGLVEGQVYRIRWLGVFVHYIDGEYLGIKVDGLVRPADQFGYIDMPFYAKRFRPVVKDKLAAFRNMLANMPTHKPFVADAPEGPVRGLPDDGEDVKKKEKEEV